MARTTLDSGTTLQRSPARPPRLPAVVMGGLGLMLVLPPLFQGLSLSGQRALLVTLITIVLWTTRWLDSGATALLAVALACAALASRSRRLGFVVSILLIALYAGCGSEQTSSQTVAGITASNGSGPVTMDGLPASLGTVSRPQPLLFPGAKK